MEDRYECPNPLCGMGFATTRKMERMHIQCPGCGATMKYRKPTGVEVFGLGVLYENGNEILNAQIRKAKQWKRTGEI